MQPLSDQSLPLAGNEKPQRIQSPSPAWIGAPLPLAGEGLGEGALRCAPAKAPLIRPSGTFSRKREKETSTQSGLDRKKNAPRNPRRVRIQRRWTQGLLQNPVHVVLAFLGEALVDAVLPRLVRTLDGLVAAGQRPGAQG